MYNTITAPCTAQNLGRPVTGQEARWAERAGIQAGTRVLDLKIGPGDYCSKEDRDTQHQGTYGVEGRHSQNQKVCGGVCGVDRAS